MESVTEYADQHTVATSVVYEYKLNSKLLGAFMEAVEKGLLH
jgi:hypothetical protein